MNFLTSVLRIPAKATAVALAAVLVLPAPLLAADDFGGYRPHYQGFGANTEGGRGGSVYRVTTLADTGTGSLRAALEATGKRIVIFEVSGRIVLQSRISITNPYLTIAGQTAPSPGITIQKNQLQINTHDIVIQHLRFRQGDEVGSSLDCLWIRDGAYNIVLDHLSLSWCTDEGVGINAAAGANPRNIAILDSIISEVLDNPTGGQPNHSRGILFAPGSGSTATLARSLFAHNDVRGPSVRGGWRIALVNNVSYNYRGSIGGTNHGGTVYMCIQGEPAIDAVQVGTVAIPGPDTPPSHVTIKLASITAYCPASKFYFQDNVGFGITSSSSQGQWAGVYLLSTTAAAVRSNTAPSWFTAYGFEVLPSGDVKAHVLANAGARPLDRDTVDQRVIRDVTNGTGRIIDDQTDVGGFPVLALNRRTLVVPLNPNAEVGASGRTTIEGWLETFARALEPIWDGTVLPTPTPPIPPRDLRMTTQ